MMEVRDLSRRFGGLLAVSGVSLTLRVGELHAVIGPNGAGTSPLVNLLAGELPPTEGSIWLNGADITRLDAGRRARAGIGRTFQRTNLMLDLPVLENVRLAAQAGSRGLLRRADRDQAPIDAALAALRKVRLANSEHAIARVLSHGQLRQLEIAVALAGQPSVLLLDEPLAGSGAEDAAPLVALMRDLSRDHAVLLVEHDMDVVFAVADIVTVMVDGRVLANGTPAEIRASATVRDAYLGHLVA
ncbi:MAG: ABC transporter ATP-binding protein [Rhodospirillales bacterium]